MYIRELPRACLRQELICIFQKKKRIGAIRWRALRLQIRYSSESIQGAVVVMACRILMWAVNANWNSGNGYWNVNANSVENQNEWNAGSQVLSCYYFLSSAFIAEVLLNKPFLHPPIILPISSISAPRETYCLLETRCASHKSWKKKRNESILPATSSSISIFLLIGV